MKHRTIKIKQELTHTLRPRLRLMNLIQVINKHSDQIEVTG